ncbi:hypothetical protein J2T57_001534 [Natronocella acetinitrilica]|uniref:Uncharacterized protein n=1 Tax=Natronocella acetinitrilica TaxID=414046 RepID=A0AAE3G2W2_9GAMM|nr:hypothetical protein [Natronocella acetinitrilica]MCP1674432.1 hypothetical protein [Natronocella acetinitrilica]
MTIELFVLTHGNRHGEHTSLIVRKEAPGADAPSAIDFTFADPATFQLHLGDTIEVDHAPHAFGRALAYIEANANAGDARAAEILAGFEPHGAPPCARESFERHRAEGRVRLVTAGELRVEDWTRGYSGETIDITGFEAVELDGPTPGYDFLLAGRIKGEPLYCVASFRRQSHELQAITLGEKR